MNFTFTYVVLHYKTWWDTEKCVRSMLRDRGNNVHIVVVNNDGDLDCQDKLSEAFTHENNVHIVFTGENLGFSRGNNAGFKFAKETLGSDFIALSNNDIVVPDDNFSLHIISKFKEAPFDILGPRIISSTDFQDQNPRHELYDSIENVENFIQNFKRLLLLSYLNLDIHLVKLKKKLVPESSLPTYPDSIDHKNEQWGVKLHGSFLVFGPNYVKNYEGLYPIKSMQMEESILNFIAKRDDLRTVYDPACKVYHKEDSATNHTFGKGVRKRRFYYSNCIASSQELLKLMYNERN